MTVNKTPSRRRYPKHKKSRDTIDRILAAMQELAENSSYDRITTNHIAKKSGVNVASIYQYFSSKEAIALTLLERTVSTTSKTMKKLVIDHLEENIERAMPALLSGLLKLYEQHASVLLRLPQEIPGLSQEEPTIELENQILRIGQLYIAQHRPDLDPIEQEYTYEFLSNSTVANIRQYLISSPYYLPEDRFIDELSKMIILRLK